MVVITVSLVLILSNHEQTIKIGVIAPLTGSQAFIGEGLVRGINLALEEARTNGKEIAIISEDSLGSVSGALTAYERLKLNKDLDMVVSISTGDEALIEKVKYDKIPLLLSVSSSSGLPKKSEYVFRYFTNADNDAPVMAKYAVNNLGLKKFGILYLLDNFGVSYEKVFRETIENLGGKVEISESFQYTDKDYKTQLSKINKQEVEAIYIVGLDYQEIEALKEVRELGIEKQIFAVGTIASQYSLKDSQGSAEGVYVTAFCTDRTAQDFVDKFTKQYNNYPLFFDEMGYDLGLIVNFGVKTVNDDKEDILNNLNSIKNFKTNSGIVGIDPSGEIVIPTCPKRIDAGNKIFNLVTGSYSNY